MDAFLQLDFSSLAHRATFLHCYQVTVAIFAVAMREIGAQPYSRLFEPCNQPGSSKPHQGGDNDILSRASYPVLLQSYLDGGQLPSSEHPAGRPTLRHIYSNAD